MKKKAVNNDPFASDDEIDKTISKPAEEVARTEGKKPTLRKKPAANVFASDDEDEDEEARKQALKAKKSSAGGDVKTAVQKRRMSESDEDEDPRPSKSVKKSRRG